MESALLYLMTLWIGPTYDDVGGRGMLTIEAYFKVALWGSIRENRNHYLPSVGIPFFQDWISQHFGMYVVNSDVNVRFEREQSAETESNEITVDFRVMTYRGKAISAESYPQETIPVESGGSEYDPGNDDKEVDDQEPDDFEEDEGYETDEEW